MKLSHLTLTAAVLSLSACGTLFNGPSDKLFFDSNVQGVTIYDNATALCTTPCKARISHHGSTTYLTAKKAGYEPVTLILQPEVSGWFWMNILTFSMPTGSITDLASGGMFKYDHDSYYADMVKVGSAESYSKKRKARKFILQNYNQIRAEIAENNPYGEYLESLSRIIGIAPDDLLTYGANMSATEFADSVLDSSEEDESPALDSPEPVSKTDKLLSVFYPDWVKMYESDGYIGQSDKRFVNYIGYGEGINIKQARDMATKDAYNKALAPITGYADGSHAVPLRGLTLSSEFKDSRNRKIKVWQLYRYPKAQLEQDIKNHTR